MSNYDDQNVFAKILRGELPAIKVYEDEHTLAFMDIMPQIDGHTLVIPKYPAVTLFNLPAELAGHLLTSVQKVGQAVKTAMQHDGIVIMQLNDKSAGQTVFHLHFHIMPTSLGALSRQSHAQTMGDPTVIQQCADKIKAALAIATL
jgi:histidine triad (HIT) family protein